MKKLALVLLLIGGLASPALAGEIQIGYAGSDYGAYKAGPGGEFTFNPLTGWIDLKGYVSGSTSDIGVKGTFQTFCIEGSEHLGPYPSTYNAQLSPNATLGNDPISVGTGWLYSQFAMGILSGYNYGQNRGDSALALQNTIWWLEGETSDPGNGNIFRAAVVAQFGTVGGAMADGGWNYGVYAVNMWTRAGGPAQDAIVYVPDGGATLMLLGGALMGLGALRRKFRQ